VLAALLCHVVDPGTPRQDPRDPGPAEGSDDGRIRARTLADGRAWEQKFCRECRLWRPHRCGHCRYCRRCVLRLDHHCVFVGTCVGERNMRFFAAFLLCAGAAFLHGVVGATRCMGSAACWSTHDALDSVLGPTVGYCVHQLYVFYGISCLAMGGCALTTAGLVYVAVMLADVDLHRRGGWRGAVAELRKLWACPGLRIYCRGPVARRVPLSQRALVDDPGLP